MTDAVFFALLTQNGLPTPTPEYRFHPSRRWRIDFAFPEQKVALEVEGGVWTKGRHLRGTGFLKDMEKYNELAARGWRLVRCTPDTLYSPETLRVLTLALAAA
jgi:very-short-patch-repair endonuclease